MLRIIAITLLVAVIAVLIVATTRPDRFHVERRIDITAAPAAIYPRLDDFHAWPQWSPYEKLDPAMQRQYDGPARGVGAGYGWSSDGKAGAGHMKIIDEVADAKLVIELAFTKPFATTNTVTFSLQPIGDTTQLTWAMDGPSPYIAKLMGLFFNMDTMIGRDFDQGLIALKQRCEAALPADPTATAD